MGMLTHLVFAAVFAGAHVAQAAPTPRPAPTPFVWSGYARSYYFTRQNASNNPSESYSPAKYNYNAINQTAFEAAVSLHGQYNAPGGFTLGTSYLFADPLSGSCDLVADQTPGLPCVVHKPPFTNPDDTLPGYQLATLYEAYAQYVGHGLSVRAGNQLINTPWANTSDSRIKPVAFQGAQLSYTFGPWTVEGMDMLRFQSRTSSFFTRTTLLTSFPPTGNSGLPGNYTPPGNVKFASNDPFGSIASGGFAFGRLGYSAHGFSGDMDYYAISNIATMLWVDGKYSARGPLRPFLAFQAGGENNAGQSVIGKIDSRMYGLQGGVNVMPAVQLVVGYDDLPWRADTMTLPTGVHCSRTTHLLSLPAPVNGYYVFPYFVPNNAPQCIPGAGGTARILYGGWASPYTDSYATDPMFTTTLTQGLADRHVAGNALKYALVFTSADHRFVGQISHAIYNAGNAGGNEQSEETNIDALYYLNHVGHGRYRGLLLHYRYGERLFFETNVYGGLPLFTYNRAQIEYDF